MGAGNQPPADSGRQIEVVEEIGESVAGQDADDHLGANRLAEQMARLIKAPQNDESLLEFLAGD